MSSDTQKPKGAARRGGPTIKDIAARANVSQATVSRVLNFDATLSVSDDVRRKIIETAAELNYATPRQRKKKTQMTSSNRIALVHLLSPEEEMGDPYYVALRMGLEQRCAEVNLDPKRLRPADLHTDKNSLAGMNGAILIGHHKIEDVRAVQEVTGNVVWADSPHQRADLDTVDAELIGSMEIIMAELFAHGDERIAYLGFDGTQSAAPPSVRSRRAFTYYTAMMEKGLWRPEYLRFGATSAESGYDMAQEVLRLETPPTAIVAGNDSIAIGVYRALADHGLTIPDDVCVVGFNDLPMAQFLTPPLASVHIPAEEIGKSAVDLLQEQIAGRQINKHLTFGTKLQRRGSLRGQEEGS